MRSDDAVRLRHMIDAAEAALQFHGHFNVDTELVWQTVNRELPALLPDLRMLLARPH
jgi:uncharacterized protein with HEPN domain